MIDCTILIPTHNRPHYLKRALTYYAPFNCQILICDSSAKPFEATIDLKNVNYIYCPEKSFIQKLSDTVALVKTSNVVLCADDDFLTFASFKKCSDFLNKNRDYTTCQGLFWGYEIKQGNFGINYSPINYNNFGQDINDDASSVRASKLMRNYMYLSYSVMNTEVLKFIYSSCYKEKITNYNLIELLVVVIPALRGKIKTLNLLHNVREVNPASSGASCEDLTVIMKEEKFKDEYNRFVKLIASELQVSDKPTAVSRIINSYLDFIKNGPTVKYPKSISASLSGSRIINYFGKTYSLITNKFCESKGKPLFLHSADRIAFESIDKQILAYKTIYN